MTNGTSEYGLGGGGGYGTSLTTGGGKGGYPAPDRTQPLSNQTLPVAGDGPMSDEDFQHIMFVWATDARNYVDEFVALDRAENTHYYHGRLPDIDGEANTEDRSRAVITEVRDTVLGMMPDILRIFFSTDSTVQFEAVATEDPEEYAKREAQAKQATEYIHRVVIGTDNPDSFNTFYDCFQDAFVRKTGMIKWWWAKDKKPLYSTHTGLSDIEAQILASDPDVEVTGKREYTDTSLPVPVPLIDLQIKRTEERGRLRIRAIPCEHIVMARRNWGNIDEMSLFGFTEDKRAGEFLSEGWIDDLSELSTCDYDITDSDNVETQARQVKPASFVSPSDNTPEDPSERLIKYGEFYVRIDKDGDGIPELRRVITAGIRYLVLHDEPVDEVQYAAFCPYPEAHTFFGQCIADLTKDIQRMKSRIVRDTLDSLAQSVVPQLTIVEGQVNLDDVLNDDASKVIRMRQPGMVNPLVMPFVGKEALPVIEYLTNVRENRTGQSDAANGLNADALQSSTAAAVQGTLNKAQSRVEFVARIFAEMGMKRLYRGILREVIRNQDPRLVVLSGKPLMLDPRHWNAEMAVTCTLVFGRGDQAQQMQALTAILQKQEQLMQMLGPENPIADFDKYSYTLQKLVELAGWRNTTSFFGNTANLNPQQKQQFLQQLQQHMQQQAQAAKSGPNPQIEMAKIQQQAKTDQMKMQIDMLKAHADTQLELLKIRGQMAVAMIEAMSDHANDGTASVLQAAVDHQSNQLDAFIQMHSNVMNAQINHHNNLMGAAVDHAGNQMADATQRAAIAAQPTGGTDQ